MKNFLAVIGGIVVGFFLLCVFVFVSSDLNMRNNTNGFSHSRSTPQTMTVTEIADKINGAMEKSAPGAFRTELDLENELFKVDMMNSFTHQEIESIRAGIGSEIWGDVRKQVLDICGDLQGRFSDNGHPEITVVYSLVDPEHPDISFLTAARGVIGYDVVRGVDLLNSQSDADGQ